MKLCLVFVVLIKLDVFYFHTPVPSIWGVNLFHCTTVCCWRCSIWLKLITFTFLLLQYDWLIQGLSDLQFSGDTTIRIAHWSRFPLMSNKMWVRTPVHLNQDWSGYQCRRRRNSWFCHCLKQFFQAVSNYHSRIWFCDNEFMVSP